MTQVADRDVDTLGVHGRAAVPQNQITARRMLEAGKLSTLDDVRERLAVADQVEGVALHPENTRFSLDDDWFVDFDRKPEDAPMAARVSTTVEGARRELTLTKAALTGLAGAVGITPTYLTKTPARLITPHLDYWYESPDRQAKLLTVGDLAVATTKATFRGFSNLQMLERAMVEVRRRYGDAEVFVDAPKWRHTLKSTSLLIVIPEAERTMRSSVESGDDSWSAGLQLLNSLVGDHGTEVGTYLFRWWCTNGATTRGSKGATFKRSSSPTKDASEVYDWVGVSTRKALDRVEDEFDRVAAMTTEPIEGEVRVAIDNLAQRYRLSTSAREAIRNEMLETPDVTMYGLMNAVTRAAQRFPAGMRERLMDVGGDFVHGAGRCDSCHSILVDGESGDESHAH